MLTKPIDLDSPRIRQQMSDGARSLLKVLPVSNPDLGSKFYITGNPRAACHRPPCASGKAHRQLSM